MNNNFEKFKKKADQLVSHYNAGNYVFVIQQINILLKKQPKNQFILNLFGSSHHKLGNLDIAKKVFLHIIQLNKNDLIGTNNLAPMNNLANIYKDLLKFEDAEILYKTVLYPILGIKDLTNNDRIGHSDNKTDIVSIKTKVDLGLYRVGFSLNPVTISEMKEIADANLKMPPKTTYIQPKLRSGLTMFEF